MEFPSGQLGNHSFRVVHDSEASLRFQYQNRIHPANDRPQPSLGSCHDLFVCQVVKEFEPKCLAIRYRWAGENNYGAHFGLAKCMPGNSSFFSNPPRNRPIVHVSQSPRVHLGRLRNIDNIFSSPGSYVRERQMDKADYQAELAHSVPT